MKKAATLLLVLLMISSLFGVTATAVESTTAEARLEPPTANLTEPSEGKVPSVEAEEVEEGVPVFQEGEDEPLPRPNHPPIDQIPPMPMPQDTDELPASEGPGLGTLYNAVTGETIVLPVDETALLGGFQQGGGYSGVDGGGGIEELPMTFYDMYKITNTGAFPWRMNAKLVMRFGSSWYVCSGTMRDAETVLTAGHCVYDYGGYGWADEIWVYPGWDGEDTSCNAENYGLGHGTYFGSWTSWTESGDLNYDVGIIGVTRAVGMLTGWFGWSYGGSCDWHKSQTYHNPSYPAECCNPPVCTLHNGKD
ncbi:MAG: trypsin-like serine protease, partial [Dehalococcoidia bacterium]|nr:trypsin-like serine protease [Dehalococcoidia bacterium]